jgi:cytochrome c553
MQAIARNLTDAEAQAAADYFSSVKYTKWVRVVESSTAPKFTATVNGLFLKEEGNETIPLGNRIVEMPEDTYQTNILRNPRSGFVAYAPIGSLKKGEALVMSAKCGTCHGADLRGMTIKNVIVPTIAGRSPSYIGRAIYDFQQGARSGANAALMKPSVQKLTEDDAIALAAYIASLEP